MSNLKKLLFTHTEHEKLQLQNKNFIPDFPELKLTKQNNIPVITQQLFDNNKNVIISKHNRFADYPLHSHQFLEINYIYQGKCHQKINGKDYYFSAGDIILMDNESRHSISALGDDDILINILFHNNTISLEKLNNLQTQNSFIYKLLLESNIQQKTKANFSIFPANKTKQVIPVLHQLLQEYFFQNDFSEKIIEHYLSILLYHLARTLSEVNQENILNKSNDPYTKLLDLIDKHYATLTLSTAAKKLNFNKNYLSNLIKEKSNQTFTQILHHKRLSHAKLLIESTQLPIQEISQMVGFSNRTFFYKKFEELYKIKPSELRK